jgi:uncharacterized protein (DUF58 family)
LDPRFFKRLERLELSARSLQISRARGQRTAKRLGVGIEFAEHRPYASGDDLRFVDFAAYARSDRLLIKQFAETQDLEVHVLLDCSASMGFGGARKLDYAKQLAAAVGYVALANLDRVTVQTFAEELGPRLAPIRGKARALSLLRFLESQVAASGTRFEHCARRFIAREPNRGLAVVISDAFDRAGLSPGLDALRYARFSPVLLQVTCRDEQFPHARGDYTLRDVETGEERAFVLSPDALAAHATRLAAHFAELRRRLREKQVPAFELDVEQPFDGALIEVLRQGGLWS